MRKVDALIRFMACCSATVSISSFLLFLSCSIFECMTHAAFVLCICGNRNEFRDHWEMECAFNNVQSMFSKRAKNAELKLCHTCGVGDQDCVLFFFNSISFSSTRSHFLSLSVLLFLSYSFFLSPSLSPSLSLPLPLPLSLNSCQNEEKKWQSRKNIE